MNQPSKEPATDEPATDEPAPAQSGPVSWWHRHSLAVIGGVSLAILVLLMISETNCK